MKIKIPASILVVCLVVFGFSAMDENAPVKTTNLLMHPVENTTASPIPEDLTVPEIKGNHGKNTIEDINVVATTDEESKKIASQFYTEIFSITGLEDGFINNIQAGESINVNNFFDETENPSQFIPLYANSKVVGIAIFREYSEGEKELGRMTERREGWHSYPPVMPYDAALAMNTKYPLINYTVSPGYYYTEDGETPYYLYEGSDGYSTKYYLVSAHNKQIIIKDGREINNNSVEPQPPVKISEDGLMEIDDSLTSDLSAEELNQLRSDIELTNRYIKDGLMVFDKNMNVITDKRHDIVKENDIFSPEKGGQQYGNYPFDDEKIKIQAEAGALIE
ncbi:MAG: hypothetical protein KZQ76_00985 [Candidatus Thiodiazotropha sp. (ex Epidulcina cf. delphinae)]|nr:hypothetical protein [Candidatus Thiodiazotropha sp. (ex Epidulcina cf. delphinae)]